MQQQNHFMQKSHKTSHCAQYTHKKYEMYISATGSTHLKSSPTLKEKLKGGVNSIPFWQEGH